MKSESWRLSRARTSWPLCAAVAGLTLLLAGCSSKPPGCSDSETLTKVRRILANQGLAVDGADQDPDLDSKLKDILRFEGTRATQYEKQVKKYSCEATLNVASKYELPIQYESQVNDQKEHLVRATRYSGMNFMALAGPLTKAYKEMSSSASKAPPSTINFGVVGGDWKAKDATLQILPLPSGTYLSVDVATAGCAGSVDRAPASVSGNVITAVKKEGTNVCTLKATVDGKVVHVEEDDCLAFHGPACSFSGDYSR